MKTDAVMCMALTRHSPSWTWLFLTRASMVLVTLTKPTRSGTSNHKCSVKTFTRLCSSGERARQARLFEFERSFDVAAHFTGTAQGDTATVNSDGGGPICDPK